MRKRDKIIQGAIPGTGAAVIEGDLRLALKMWKQDLNESGKLKKLFEKRHYVKPSVKRKKILDAAKYRQRFIA